jgi:hypothetical protein
MREGKGKVNKNTYDTLLENKNRASQRERTREGKGEVKQNTTALSSRDFHTTIPSYP